MYLIRQCNVHTLYLHLVAVICQMVSANYTEKVGHRW